MTNDELMTVFKRHPKPWSIHPEYPREGFQSDADGVIMDANGVIVLSASEWLIAHDGVITAIILAVNGEAALTDEELIETMAAATFEKGHRIEWSIGKSTLPFAADRHLHFARAALTALREAGYEIVQRETIAQALTDEAQDMGLYEVTTSDRK